MASVLMQPMGRYVWPWTLYCASVLAAALQASWSSSAAGALFVAASVVWLAVTATARPVRQVHFWLAWAPCILPVVALAFSLWASIDMDVAVIAVLVAFPIALSFLAASAVTTILLWLSKRRQAATAGPEAHP